MSGLVSRVEKIERQYGVPASDEQHVLECLMRFVIVWAHLNTVVKFGHKMREQMTPDEWAAFIAGSVKHFNGDVWLHKRERMINHICRSLHMEDSELPDLIAEFVTWPDASEYCFKPA